MRAIAEKSKYRLLSIDIYLSPDELQEIDAIGRTVNDRLDENPVMWNFDV